MTDDDNPGADLRRLRPGDPVQAWEQGVLRYTGTVEQSIPNLGVVWITEAGFGARKLLSTAQYDLRPDTLPSQ